MVTTNTSPLLFLEPDQQKLWSHIFYLEWLPLIALYWTRSAVWPATNILITFCSSFCCNTQFPQTPPPSLSSHRHGRHHKQYATTAARRLLVYVWAPPSLSIAGCLLLVFRACVVWDTQCLSVGLSMYIFACIHFPYVSSLTIFTEDSSAWFSIFLIKDTCLQNNKEQTAKTNVLLATNLLHRLQIPHACFIHSLYPTRSPPIVLHSTAHSRRRNSPGPSSTIILNISLFNIIIATYKSDCLNQTHPEIYTRLLFWFH